MDGKNYSNTFRLVETKGYSAVYIESDSSSFEKLLATASQYPSIHPIHRTVEPTGANTLDAILSETPIPNEFDILSIDIDSCDYQVWDSVKVYRPRIVVIEIESTIPPTKLDSIHGSGSPNGTGFLPMAMLGLTKGYTLVCHTGNLIFVRTDCAHLYSDLLVPPETCYISDWIYN
jgi:hypothetical protein